MSDNIAALLSHRLLIFALFPPTNLHLHFSLKFVHFVHSSVLQIYTSVLSSHILLVVHSSLLQICSPLFVPFTPFLIPPPPPPPSHPIINNLFCSFLLKWGLGRGGWGWRREVTFCSVHSLLLQVYICSFQSQSSAMCTLHFCRPTSALIVSFPFFLLYALFTPSDTHLHL